MKSIIVFLVVSILSGYCNIIAQDPDLAEGFRDPGVEARPRAYWNWLNGDVSPTGLTRDLEEAKDKGLGGLLMWDTEAMRNPDGFVPAGPPFLADISPFPEPGTNELKIEVMNLWINRLSGDMNLPPGERYTSTNISSDGATPKVSAEPWHVQPAGLLGLVRLVPSVLLPISTNKL